MKQQLAKSPALQAAARDAHAALVHVRPPGLSAACGESRSVCSNRRRDRCCSEPEIGLELCAAAECFSRDHGRAESSLDRQRRPTRSSADVVATAKELGISLDILAPSRSPDQPAASPAEIPLVQAAQRVLIGSETAFQVTVRPHHVLNQLSLVVEEDGQEIDRRELTGLVAGQDRFEVVTHRPKEAGLKRYRFQLMQGETPVAEPYAVNVQAVDDRHDVLILEDSWRWEFKYLPPRAGRRSEFQPDGACWRGATTRSCSSANRNAA